MNRLILSSIFTFLFTLNASSQTKEYLLYDKTYSANLNKNIRTHLDTTRRGMSLLDNVFKPIKGDYIVYRFIAKYIGWSFTNKQKEFHDLLIVKTDTTNRIIDAYQYTLEWADSPNADLYKSNCKQTYLTGDIEVSDFKFKRLWYYDRNNRQFRDSGLVITK